jgi:hypothetical protein
MNKKIQTEALSRAASGQSLANYPSIYTGFTQRGIPESEIEPRKNVFTYETFRRPWRATVFHISQTQPME